MTYRKYLLWMVALLLLSVGVAAGQSSVSYVLQQTALFSGGVAESDSYRVESVIGQPAAGRSTGKNIVATAGFVLPRGQDGGFEIWLPLVSYE